MKRVAVILAGCGANDGSEIHEATLALWALGKYDIDYQCFALDKNQFHVINHYEKTEQQETRNMLVESARIARSKILPMSKLKSTEFDGIVFPGGYGAAKNLCNFAFKGKDFAILPEIENVVKNFNDENKPIVALCIAPVIIAKVLKAKVTIGTDVQTAAAIEFVGGTHENKNYDDFCFDATNKVISTPCYMLAENPYQISLGIEKAIEKLKKII
jgi:enhancing lycopene biosynthesis protein 2